MSSNLNDKQVSNVTRRTWDVEVYEKKAEARHQQQQQQQQLESGGDDESGQQRHVFLKHTTQKKHVGSRSMKDENPKSDRDEEFVVINTVEKPEFVPAPSNAAGPIGSKRAFLKARIDKVSDIDARVGKTALVSVEQAATTASIETDKETLDSANANTVIKTGVGWHCKVCDCYLKDSHTYLDHINGRKHQRKLGYSMRVERSTKEQLMEKLGRLAKKEEQHDTAAGINAIGGTLDDFHDLIRAKDEQAERLREERRKRRKNRKAGAFSGIPLRTDEIQRNTDEKHSEENKEDEDGDDEADECGINPDMAAMMGFAGFGGGKANI